MSETKEPYRLPGVGKQATRAILKCGICGGAEFIIHIDIRSLNKRVGDNIPIVGFKTIAGECFKCGEVSYVNPQSITQPV
jgi:hypothetical protein